MNIRDMVLDDYSQVINLWRECELSDEPEDGKEDIESLLQSPQGGGFVACVNGNIAGAVLCGSDGRYGYIHHLAVSKNKRNQGIGSALVDACVRFLNRRHVIIMVRKNNTIGNEFWNRLQFQKAEWIEVRYIKTMK